MKSEFPYEKFKSNKIWNVVDRAVDNLVENNDIEERTNREYIIGFLCKTLCEAGLTDLNTKNINNGKNLL